MCLTFSGEWYYIKYIAHLPLMIHPLKLFTVFLFAVGLVIVPAVSMNTTSFANAQSAAGTQQQTSQPPTSATATSNSTGNATSKAPEVGQIFSFNGKSKPANDPQKCAELASKVTGKAVPDYNLCDVVVYRQAPAITRNDNVVLNNFSGIGHYIEFIPAKTVNETGMFMGNSGNNASAAGGNNDNGTNQKVAFGEFALIDSEVVPVRQVMNKYNWTETALHHHMLNETPKILFLHWTVTGDANDLINQAKEIMMQTSTYQNLTGNTHTPSSSGP
jgi:hypothetical protein